jgi:hypothetical protein
LEDPKEDSSVFIHIPIVPLYGSSLISFDEAGYCVSVQTPPGYCVAQNTSWEDHVLARAGSTSVHLYQPYEADEMVHRPTRNSKSKLVTVVYEKDNRKKVRLPNMNRIHVAHVEQDFLGRVTMLRLNSRRLKNISNIVLPVMAAKVFR